MGCNTNEINEKDEEFWKRGWIFKKLKKIRKGSNTIYRVYQWPIEVQAVGTWRVEGTLLSQELQRDRKPPEMADSLLVFGCIIISRKHLCLSFHTVTMYRRLEK